MKTHLLLALPLLLATGCTTSKTPLVFLSKTSVGVDISAPGTGTGEFGASIGVNTLDAAYVPVVERVENNKETIHQVKSGEALTAQERESLTNLLATQIGVENSNIASFQSIIADNSKTTTERQKAASDLDRARSNIQTLSTDLGRVLSRNDALSVFSAFDSNTILRSDNANQGIGKIFATGLAAQNVSRNFNQEAQAQAACKSEIAPAAAALIAKNDQPSRDLAVKLLEACEK